MKRIRPTSRPTLRRVIKDQMPKAAPVSFKKRKPRTIKV